VEGTVIMSAIIATNGTVLNPTVRNTVDPRLASAALEAVRQWVYKPALLNGEPVETATTITLEFQLGQ
jgi:protein TonB